MPIEFACPCGRVVRAPDAAAGRRSRFPGCGAPITVPEPTPAPAPIDEATRVRPQCCETIPASAQTCRHCGEWLEAEPAVECDLPAEAHLEAVALSCQAAAALVLIAATFGAAALRSRRPGPTRRDAVIATPKFPFPAARHVRHSAVEPARSRRSASGCRRPASRGRRAGPPGARAELDTRRFESDRSIRGLSRPGAPRADPDASRSGPGAPGSDAQMKGPPRAAVSSSIARHISS